MESEMVAPHHACDRSEPATAKRRVSRVRLRTLLAAVLLFGALVVVVLLVAFVLKVAVMDLLYIQGYVGRALEADLGFEGHSPWVYDGDELVEVLAIRKVIAEGVFDQGGLMPGDIVIGVELRQSARRWRANHGECRGNFITRFYELLQRARDGGTMVVTVVCGANRPDDRRPLEDRPKRKCVLTIKSSIQNSGDTIRN